MFLVRLRPCNKNAPDRKITLNSVERRQQITSTFDQCSSSDPVRFIDTRVSVINLLYLIGDLWILDYNYVQVLVGSRNG